MSQRNKQFSYAREKAAKSEHLGTAWPVFRTFEIEEGTEHDVIVYAPHKPPELPEPKDPGVWQRIPTDLLLEDANLEREYAPLRDEPDLFLTFASLARDGFIAEDEAREVMLGWVKSYGVLGLEGIDRSAGVSLRWREGRRESLYGFVSAVRRAAWCLSLYEAATAPDGPDAEALQRHKADGNTLEEKKEWALEAAGNHVDDQLTEECYPKLYRQVLAKSGETVGFAQGWGFHSLLGAMYLQMAWLMSEGSNAPRCKGPGCYRIIRIGDLERPVADPGLKKNARGNYRIRKDKQFCSRNCKEKWRYHYVLKPRRQSQRL